MKGTEKMVPELRFKEFSDLYAITELGNTIQVLTDYHANGSYERLKENVELKEEPHYAVMIRTTNLEANDFRNNLLYISKSAYEFLKKSKVYGGDIIINKIANAGATYIMPELDRPVSLAMNLFLLRIKSEYSSSYIYFQLKTNEHKLKNLASGTSTKTITKDDVRSFKMETPSLPEQEKIASFLSAVDAKISQLSRKKELLGQYKKGMMQKLFPPAGGQAPEIRFKDDNGNDFPNWEEKKLGDVFERVKRKNQENNLNVLTISAQQGLVNQIDYFNHSVSAKDLTGYYLLKKGEFAYNKSYSKGYPMGAIKRLDKYEKGVVSTLYICFRLKEKNDSTFYKEYLDGGGINHEIHKIAQEGARNHGLLNMSVVEFFKDIVISRPPLEEQKKIEQFLFELNKKIELVGKELDEAQRFKKGLLQKMFV